MPESARKDLVEFSAKIPRSLYERFKARFPFHGATTYVIETLVEEIVTAAEREPTLREQVKDSVRKMFINGR